MQLIKILLLLVLSTATCLSSCAQTSSAPERSFFPTDSLEWYQQQAYTDPMKYILKSYEASHYNYLVPYYLSLQTKVDSADESLNFYHQTMLTTFSSFVGDVKANESAYIYSGKDTTVADDPNYTAINAMEEIVSVARTHQVMMFNESHIDPRGRLFLCNLLPSLKAAGFRYLFLEGLREDDINERGFPLQTSGFYTCEPMFGNLLRTALQLGFKLVPYDCYKEPCKTVAQREEHQATTIYETLKKYPQAKALVFAGHGHINKDPEKNRMAYRFKVLSGIDPFCIDQAVNSETPTLFRQLRKHIQQAAIYKNLKTNSYRPLSPTITVDATVVFPNTQWIDGGYAAWLLHNGKKPYKLELRGEKYEQTLLSIVKCHEFDQYGALAVPVINMMLQSKNEQKILLDKGLYYILVTNLYGKELYKKKIKL